MLKFKIKRNLNRRRPDARLRLLQLARKSLVSTHLPMALKLQEKAGKHIAAFLEKTALITDVNT